MSPSPQFNFAESKPCGDPSHGDGFQADVERALCKEPKVLKLGRAGAVHNVHASSVGIRGGGSALAVKRPSHSSTVKASTPKQPSFVAISDEGDRQLALDKPTTAVHPDTSIPDGKVSTKTPKKVTFKTINEDAPTPSVVRKISRSSPDKSMSLDRTTISESDAAPPQKRPHFRTEQTRAELRRAKVLVSAWPGEHDATPPAALSAKGRALTAMQEWEEVEKPGLQHAGEDGCEDEKDASGEEEIEDGWMVV